MSSADRVAHIDGHHAIIVSKPRAGGHNAEVKPSNPFTNVCWVSV